MSIFDAIARWFGWAPDAPAEPPVEVERPRKRKRIVQHAAPVEPGPVAEADAPGDASEDDDAEEGTGEEEEEERERRPRATAADDAHLDAGLRSRLERGDFDGMLEWLDQEGGVLLAGHEVSSLPCLCVTCLRPDVTEAEAAGVAFSRDFAVSRRRVLFYWAPVELAGDAEAVRRSMRSAIRVRLRDSVKGEQRPREGVNPFTKERMIIMPKGSRAPRNPFVKKPST